MSFSIVDYIDVKERVKLFYAKFPEGSLQFEFKGQCQHDPSYIWGVAKAYRTPDDPQPAIGTAQELAQGKTSFTRGSEMQNLETSAWGRAISALGLGIDKSIASRDEVQFAQARQDDNSGFTFVAGNVPSTQKQRDLINKLVAGDLTIVENWKTERGIEGVLSASTASELIEHLLANKDAK